MFPPPQLLNAWTRLYETWYVHHGTWAHINGVIHKSLPSACLCMCIPLSLTGNGPVNMLPWQWIHETKSYWICCFLCSLCHIKNSLCVFVTPHCCKKMAWYMLLHQQRIVEGILYGPCCIKGNEVTSSSQNFLFMYHIQCLIAWLHVSRKFTNV
jgi:hypothetical protein